MHEISDEIRAMNQTLEKVVTLVEERTERRVSGMRQEWQPKP